MVWQLSTYMCPTGKNWQHTLDNRVVTVEIHMVEMQQYIGHTVGTWEHTPANKVVTFLIFFTFGELFIVLRV